MPNDRNMRPGPRLGKDGRGFVLPTEAGMVGVPPRINVSIYDAAGQKRRQDRPLEELSEHLLAGFGDKP